MSDEQRSVTVFEYYRASEERFEYFLLGVSLALCAYVGQTIKPEKIGVTPYTLEVVSLVLLVCSVIIGFKRAEQVVLINLLNHQILHQRETRRAFFLGFKGEPLQELGTGKVYRTQEEVNAEVKGIDALIAQKGTELGTAKEKSMRYYRLRNRFLIVGFVGLLVARILEPYFAC